MLTSEVYLVEGLTLFVLSCLTMNTLFSEGAKDYLNSRYELAYKIAYLTSFIFVLTWISGTLYFFFSSTVTRYLMILSSEIFWIVALSINLMILRDLWVNAGARFNYKMEYLNIIFYLATLWLLSYHISMSYMLLAILSTVSSVIILYFTALLRKYISLIGVFVIPVDVYKFFLSFVVVSAMFSLILLARTVGIHSYLFFVILIYVFVIFVLLSLIKELKPLISKA
ncbi:hypothetical protein Ferp_1799 [Ferroglobus placidus DSM 10642]|uniref:Uncharacterized protein n=2 Tax=Ferroglobus placidus TaxID=54261 RepID=D3RZM9_FERPA|nr:hypothetical protein Ferp_1799 [Ferroglobus placidus DSM 10642]